MICNECETVAHCTKHGCIPKQPAPVPENFIDALRFDVAMRDAVPVQEPVGYLFQHEETGLTTVVDVQQVEWGFEKNNPRHQKIGPVYTIPPAQPAVPDAITDRSESPEYIQGWNDCRLLMLKGMKS
jgi:hypothetical protein